MNNSGKKLNNETKQSQHINTLSSVFSTLFLMLLCSSISLYSVSAKAQEFATAALDQEPLEQTLNADNPPVVPEAEGTPIQRDYNEKFNQKVAELTEERERLSASMYKFTPTDTPHEAVNVGAPINSFTDMRTPKQEADYAQADAIVEQYNNNESERYDNQRLQDTIAVGFFTILIIIFMIITLNYYKKLKPKIESTIHERQTSKAYDELLKYKKLFDENLISQEEFENRSREIKSKIQTRVD